MKNLEDFLRPTQKQLFKRLVKKFKGKTLISKGNFILVKGEAPVMLVAHLDTVHEQPVKDICISADGNILMSPQGIGGDDRCGVFALVKAYRLSKIKPWLLFCCDEEIGGLGAKQFCLAHQQLQLPKKSTLSNFSSSLTVRAKMTPFITAVIILILRLTSPAKVLRPRRVPSPTFPLSRRNLALLPSIFPAVITRLTRATNISTVPSSLS